MKGSTALLRRIYACLTIACFICGQAAPAYAAPANEPKSQGPEPLRYRTRAGDTLGNILNHLGVCPLWGKGKKVEQTIELNPDLESTAGNELYPNQWVTLPVSQLPQDQDYAVSPSGEVEIIAQNPAQKCKAGAWQARQSQQIPSRAIAAEPVPSPEPRSESHPEPFDQYSLFSVEPKLSNSRINAKDLSSGTSSTLLSGINYGASVGWHPVLSKTFELGVQAGFESQKYSINSTTKSLDNANVVLGSFSIEAKDKLSPNTTLGLIARDAQMPFIRGENVAAIALDSVAIPELGASLNQSFYRGGLFAFGSKLSASFLAPSSTDSYQIRSGYDGKLELWMSQNLRTHDSFGAGVFYERRIQNTSIANEDFSAIGVLFRWDFDAFSPSRPQHKEEGR